MILGPPTRCRRLPPNRLGSDILYVSSFFPSRGELETTFLMHFYALPTVTRQLEHGEFHPD